MRICTLWDSPSHGSYACDRTLERAREGRRARSPPSSSSGQADRVQGCDGIFSDGSELRRAGLGTLAPYAGHHTAPDEEPMDGASAGDRTAPLPPRSAGDCADDSGTALAERSALELDGVRERLERTQAKDDAKAYRPPEFEGDEVGDEFMSL